MLLGKNPIKMMKSKKPLQTGTWGRFASILALSFLVFGCAATSTVTPSPVVSEEPSFDSTTPEGYAGQNGGVIKILKSNGHTVGAILTKDGRNRYNWLVDSYRIQIFERYGRSLEADSGIVPIKDTLGNDMFFIDSDRLFYFIRMNLWSKANRPHDTVWMKLKDKVSMNHFPIPIIHGPLAVAPGGRAESIRKTEANSNGARATVIGGAR